MRYLLDTNIIIYALKGTYPAIEKHVFTYGKLRADLKKNGQLIGANDMLIAAVALTENCVLITHNTDEFKHISNLMIEDWTM